VLKCLSRVAVGYCDRAAKEPEGNAPNRIGASLINCEGRVGLDKCIRLKLTVGLNYAQNGVKA